MESLLGVLVSTLLLLPAVSAQGCAAVTSRFSPRMGSGYTARVIATGLSQPRHIALDSAGNLLVAEGGSGSVRRLVLRDDGSNVCVASTSVVTSDRSTNHGIALSADGKMLFTSNLASVTAYSYDASTGKAGAGKVIITGMSNAGTHPTRAILTSKIQPDTIVVARGSNGNIDTTTAQQSTGRGIIKYFSISKTMQTPAQYASSGEVLAWGLRNIVGMGEDPLGGFWSVENSLDDLRFNGRDVHNDNPAEKMNYHGSLNDTANRLRGANFGYPSCFPAWDTQGLGNGLEVGQLFMPDSVLRATDCASRQQGRVHFPAHTAPLDVKFTPNATAAYVSFHGSWNRRPADGYRVMRVDFRNGQPVAPANSRTAAVAIMENSNVGSCPSACFRPVGLEIDKKGRIFVSSDSTGEIYVIYPPA